MSEKIEPLIDIEVEADGWLDALPDVQEVVQTGILAALKAVDVTEQTDIVVLLCDDAEMKSLNKEYRQKNAPTNVLSFPMLQPGFMEATGMADDGEILLGDVVLAYETCLREATEKAVTLEQHATHLIVHGVLHLLGYDHVEHEDQAREMEAMETHALASLGIADPYAEH